MKKCYKIRRYAQGALIFSHDCILEEVIDYCKVHFPDRSKCFSLTVQFLCVHVEAPPPKLVLLLLLLC